MGSDVLASFLSRYFELAFELGIFPQSLKIAKVVPVYKSGNKEQINNYRPTFLLPSLNKVVEKLVKTHMVKFFGKNKIFHDF